MIRPNYEYRVYKGKVSANGRHTTFSMSESERNKQTNQWETLGWWDVIVSGNFPCDKDDKVTFKMTAITGVTRSDYNGRTYTKIFADAVVNYKGATYINGEVQSAQLPNPAQTYQQQTDAYKAQTAVDRNGYPLIDDDDNPFPF